MQRYRSYRPTGFDMAGLNAYSLGPDEEPDRSEWFVAPCGRNRDSGILTESNFQVIVKRLRAVDPEENDFQECEFNHWACGWFGIILVRPDSPACKVAEEAEASLENYPILDEFDHSDRETEAIDSEWSRMSVRERYDAIRSARGISIFAARRDYLPEDPDGSLSEVMQEYVRAYA